ncbi:ribosomal biogenesis GTPase [Vibrionales bacterium SWAT-3]|nr:ribosomal biogenesis GTPase [Vibrionales bacterium SWAT-3]
MSALVSNASFAQEVNHSSVVQTVFYDQVDPKYHDSLYLFQLVLSKNCLTYRSEEKPCEDYLKEKYDSVSSDWYQEQEPIKKQYLNIKLEMISNTALLRLDELDFRINGRVSF